MSSSRSGRGGGRKKGGKDTVPLSDFNPDNTVTAATLQRAKNIQQNGEKEEKPNQHVARAVKQAGKNNEYSPGPGARQCENRMRGGNGAHRS